MQDKILFAEKQKIIQWWIWLLIVGFNFVFYWMMYMQLVLGKQVGDSPISDLGVVLIYIPMLLITILFFYFKLETRIEKEGIYVRFFPFHIRFRFYPWESIEKVYTRTYKPMKEYGGWGIKGSSSNRTFNFSGKEGLQLELKNGNKLLIGTQKIAELNELLIRLNK
jgi:amino acid transporter